MEMQHQSVSSLARWAQNVYVALAGLILLGIFTQGFLIGTMLFGGNASGLPSLGAVAGSLHPANATLLFGVDVFLLVKAWQCRRSK